MRVQKSKVDILHFASWKHELAMQVFNWLSKSLEGQNPGYSEGEFVKYKQTYAKAAAIAAKRFTLGGFAGTNIYHAQEPDGPVIVSYALLPGDDERPNTTIEPIDILKDIEEELNSSFKDEFEEGIFKVLKYAIFQIRSAWFCEHDWITSMYPEMAEGHQIEIEVCCKCQAERIKQ